MNLTPSKRWLLECASISSVAGGYGGCSVVTDFRTGETTYGHQTRVVDACKTAGWIDNAGHITPAGRAALKEGSRQ